MADCAREIQKVLPLNLTPIAFGLISVRTQDAGTWPLKLKNVYVGSQHNIRDQEPYKTEIDRLYGDCGLTDAAHDKGWVLDGKKYAEILDQTIERDEVIVSTYHLHPPGQTPEVKLQIKQPTRLDLILNHRGVGFDILFIVDYTDVAQPVLKPFHILRDPRGQYENSKKFFRQLALEII